MGRSGGRGGATHVVLMAATITVGTIAVGVGRRGADALHDVSAALFALLYLGLPLGALVAIRVAGGREALLLLLVCVMMSDTVQYYGGRGVRPPTARAGDSVRRRPSKERPPGSWLARW